MNNHFKIFNNIENNLKEMNSNWFIDSFIDDDEMRIKIKEIDKYYVISITFDFIIHDNTIDLSISADIHIPQSVHDIALFTKYTIQ